MSTIAKAWQLQPVAPASLLRRYKGVNPVLAQVLHNRGIAPEQVALFLGLTRPIFEPFAMKDMARAVGRIRQAIKQGEKIAVYGDFDADGVTSTALMVQVLRSLKADVIAYIPDRVDEGYGLNSPALLGLAKQGVKLVVTVDCGIRSVQEVEDANAVGLDIVITDHHSVGSEIPNAFAVVNPQQVDCGGDKQIAGCGVALMVAIGLLQKHLDEFGEARLPKLRQSDLLDLVALGTVADIMPLNNLLNRALIKHGLNTMNEGRRLGLRVLAEVSGLKLGQISAQDIGFAFGPRINAAGRLANALTAYELLSSTSESHARKLADELNNLNRKRQDLTRDAQERVRNAIVQNGADQHVLIFAQDDEVLAGIVGLVAGRLTEEYYRPTVILEHGEHESRASCRSIPEFHITNALDACADLLSRHGGHGMAAGFTVPNENLPLLRERLLQQAEEALGGRDLKPMLEIDMELSLRQLTLQLAEDLQALEPTGHKNPPPVFVTYKLEVAEARPVGNDNAHLKLKLRGDSQPPVDAIAFRFGDWAQQMPAFVDVVYALEINEWQGRKNLQLRILDMRPSP